MNPDYWIKRFLAPYALNKVPLKLSDYPVFANVEVKNNTST